jgi:hypothetical protein
MKWTKYYGSMLGKGQRAQRVPREKPSEIETL